MKQEDKELLLKDLCARLPYGVEIHIDFTENGHIVGDAVLDTIKTVTGELFDFTDFKRDSKNADCYPISGFGSNKHLHLKDFKPYLRPMSSMTEEEKDEYFNSYDWEYFEEGTPFDWLNAHHFDYRGLIEKGLALEAPDGMYMED